jgi:hypothetical protein
MRKIFESVQTTKPKSSAFDLSHDKKMSLKFGKLYPILCEEVVPSDNFMVNSEVLIRMAPMLAPIMHKVDVSVHYFFVPNRLLWNQWEEFITGGKNGDSVITPPMNSISNNIRADKGTLSDYLGIPYTVNYNLNPISVNALPYRAYAEIWNEYYRDQNLTDPIDITGSYNWWELLDRAWEKDYFTSALPWSQRGPAVGIPLNGQIDVTYDPTSEVKLSNGADPSTSSLTTDNGSLLAGGNSVRIENIDGVDLSSADISITELRRSNALQKFYEKAARAGGRYKEQLLAYFGVNSEDARLDRPEYLGGGKQPVIVSEILNTTGDTGATNPLPQGNMSGHGITVGGQNSFKRRFTEHGFVMGIMSVLPRTAYQQGLNRMWTRDDRFDYLWPDFADIGEQEVKQKELYLTGQSEDDENTFGYQQRYAEYKYKSSTVHGDFRDTLDYWHMGRKFDSPPSLNATFVQSNPTDRIFAVQDDSDYLYAHIYHDFKAIRPLPFFSNPKL